MKYGFFGGSFNPPTLAHLEIAKQSLEKFNLDEVFFVPMSNMYNKPELADEKYRYDMLKFLIKNEKNLKVEDIELKCKYSLSAIDAFDMIKKKYLNSENYYIMGADNLVKIPMWPDAEKLLCNYKLIVFERIGSPIEEILTNNELIKKYLYNIQILKIEENNNCRSGIIRELVKCKKYEEACKYTKADVVEYIKKEKIYIIK